MTTKKGTNHLLDDFLLAKGIPQGKRKSSGQGVALKKASTPSKKCAYKSVPLTTDLQVKLDILKNEKESL